jgi:hypothetical protein
MTASDFSWYSSTGQGLTVGNNLPGPRRAPAGVHSQLAVLNGLAAHIDSGVDYTGFELGLLAEAGLVSPHPGR